jgi:hypothetical protein
MGGGDFYRESLAAGKTGAKTKHASWKLMEVACEPPINQLLPNRGRTSQFTLPIINTIHNILLSLRVGSVHRRQEVNK